jgi:hypothetical protein
MFEIKSWIAVLWRNINETQPHYDLLSPIEWCGMQRQAKAGLVVIVEAWKMGKCISN